MGTAKITYIIPVLNSHEVVRRQCLYLSRVLGDDWCVVVVDDGSQPPLMLPPTDERFTPIRTGDKRPWTQPRARNVGFNASRTDWVVLIDVDHVLLPEAVRACEAFTTQDVSDFLMFKRRIAALDEGGELVTDSRSLSLDPWNVPLGQPLERKASPSACMVRASIYQRIGGYDEGYCGRYGGDDGDFNRRYLTASRRAPHYTDAAIGLFPNMKDPKWFHGLDRIKGEPKRKQPVEPAIGVAV